MARQTIIYVTPRQENGENKAESKKHTHLCGGNKCLRVLRVLKCACSREQHFPHIIWWKVLKAGTRAEFSRSHSSGHEIGNGLF